MTVEVKVPIRWRDVDAYGHVNNAVFLNYLEEARDRLVESLFGERAWDFVIARVAIDYRNELNQEDREVVVRCRDHGVRHLERTNRGACARGGRQAVGGIGVGHRREGPRDRSEPPADGRMRRRSCSARSTRAEVSASLYGPGFGTGKDAPTVDEVLPVPPGLDPHQGHAAHAARGVERPSVADEDVDVVDRPVAVAVVEHQIPGPRSS